MDCNGVAAAAAAAAAREEVMVVGCEVLELGCGFRFDLDSDLGFCSGGLVLDLDLDFAWNGCEGRILARSGG